MDKERERERDVNALDERSVVDFLPSFAHRIRFLLSLLHHFYLIRSAPTKRPHPFFIAAGLKVDVDGGNDR
jgi:hypothetical protein